MLSSPASWADAIISLNLTKNSCLSIIHIFSDLLTGESPKLRGYVLTRSGQGLAFDRRKQYHYQHLAYNFAHKLAEPFIVTVEQDAPGTVKQAHSHEGQEFDYVLEGYLKIILGGNELLLSPGDSLYYDSSLPHAM